MSYTLYNKETGRTLDFRDQTWTCETLEEAREMLEVCLECVDTFPGCNRNNFVIVDADTGEQVHPLSDFE